MKTSSFNQDGSGPVDADVVVYLHIPKTGGSTLVDIMRRQYPPGATRWFSYQRPEQVAAFEALSETEIEGIQLLAGHFPFGIHRRLPGKATYVTMLRDPVGRFISEYKQVKRKHWQGDWHPPSERLRSLDDFLDYRIETNATDVQTRFLSGCFPPPGSKPPFDPLPGDALERAKQNIEDHFSMVGVMERFDESLLLMKRQLGWPHRVSYVRQNTAPQSTSPRDMSTKLLERISESSSSDVALVEFATERMNRLIGAEESRFFDDLERLRRKNANLERIAGLWNRAVPARLRNGAGGRLARRVGRTIMR